MNNIAKVIIDRPAAGIDRPFDYLIPPEMLGRIKVGAKVLVSFGNTGKASQDSVQYEKSLAAGVVIGLTDKSDFPKLKPIFQLTDETLIEPELLDLARFVSDYYLVHFNRVLQLIFPEGNKFEVLKTVRLTDRSAGMIGLKKKELLEELPQLGDEVFTFFRSLLTKAGKSSGYINSVSGNKDALGKGAQASAEDRDYGQPWVAENYNIRSNRYQIKADLIRELEAAGLIQTSLKVRTIADKTATPGEEADIDELRRRSQDFLDHLLKEDKTIIHTEEQKAAIDVISKAVTKAEFNSFLLQGVTGSGKTEVYLAAAKAARAKGRSSLVLVPEISLTPQIFMSFEKVFPGRIGVLHSMLSPKERLIEWNRIADGERDVVIGVRSAVFAPLPELGLIIVDEEHETTYKQDTAPRYHARDVAIKRAQLCNAIVVLGSATPSVETRYRAEYSENSTGKAENTKHITRLILPTKFHKKNNVAIELVDLRGKEHELIGGDISKELFAAAQQHLEKGNQVIMFLNKRGYSRVRYCVKCGHVPQCPNCSVPLAVHLKEGILKCHHCDLTKPADEKCTECSGDKFRYYGFGTQRAEEFLQKNLEGYGVARLDSDVAKKKFAILEVLTDFLKEESQVLIGTQMIAKGLDFPNVTLVGILNADGAMHLPDFRATERTLNLLMQVSGRTGRRTKPGVVMIQTSNPEHYVLEAAARGDYEYFYKKEIEIRRILNYPPFARLINVVFTHEDADIAQATALKLTDLIRGKAQDIGAYVLGPAEAPFSRIKGKYRYHSLIKIPVTAKDQHKFKAYLWAVAEKARASSGSSGRGGLKSNGISTSKGDSNRGGKYAAVTLDVDPTWVL